MTNNVEFAILAGMFLAALGGVGAALWSGDWRPLLACLPLALFLKAAL